MHKGKHFNKVMSLLYMFLFLPFIYIGQEDNKLLRHIYALHDEVSAPSKQVGNLNPDSVPSLPIGLMKEIGGTKYIIAIDSAEFTPQGAYFNAYMALEFPGADGPIAFAAKHIKFNPKGVVGGELAKLQLVSEHFISLGPNTELHLPPNGNNYIEWDCNGFKSVNLQGDFRFSDGILIPDSSTTDTIVKADFQVHVNDIHNILAEINFTPFQVKGLKGFTFTINQAFVDMSDFDNPYGMNVPSNYQGDNSTLWRGFYLKDFNVKVPSEISKKGEPTEIYAHDMLIDDAGVSGIFGATNIFDATEGDMNGWGFSIDELSIELTTNQLTGGGMKGRVEIPPLDNNAMNYEALVSANSQTDEVDFNFTVKPDSTVTMNCFAATLTLYNSSSITIQKQSGKFKPTLILNGKLSLEEPVFKLSGVDFENLTLVTQTPYITNGIFALISDTSTTSNASENNVSNFPISVSNITLGINQGQVVLGTDLAFNLSGENQSDEENSFSAETHVNVYSIAEQEEQFDLLGTSMGNKLVWSYDKLVVSDIDLDIQTQPFNLDGTISFKKNDPVYGNGFYGALNLEIPSVMKGSMYLGCAFGKISGYKYWFVDAAIPVNITCGYVKLTSLMGGMSNHMTGQKTPNEILSQLSSGQTLNGSSQTYVPDANAGISFRAGVGLEADKKEEAFNGDVLFEINFNANGGLSNISLIGDAYMLVKRAERKNATQFVHGTVSILYDNVTEILDAQLSANAQFSNAITGSLWSQIYISPAEWHIFMGTPSNQATINIANLASANAYLMIGQNLPPMPPPPPQVQQIFNNASLGSQRDDAAIVNGDGIATGVNFNVSFNKSVNFGQNYSIYGMGSAGAGFDMTLYNYGPNAHCSGSSERIGLNSWYLNGQLYAYFMLNIGITGRLLGNDFDISLLNGNAALLLQGKLPKPTYVNGAVALNATVLSVINVNLNFDFEFGNNCTIVQ